MRSSSTKTKNYYPRMMRVSSPFKNPEEKESCYKNNIGLRKTNQFKVSKMAISKGHLNISYRPE